MSGVFSRAARIVLILAGALAVFAVWVATASVNSGITFFLCLPVGLAAWWFGLRAGLAAATGCIALFALGDALNPVPEFGLSIVIRAAFFLAAAASFSWLAGRMRKLEHSAEELDAIRAALAPADLPDLPGVDAAATFVPSELGVSGDFYLLTNGPDGSTVAIVGDVVGHGPAAARLATFVRARFAALAAGTSDPAELLMLVNTALTDRPARERKLVTAVCVRLGPGEGKLSWARAGHPPPLSLPELSELRGDGATFLLGAQRRLELRNSDAALRGSEGLVIYTDGATDVSQGRQMLGLEGLRRALAPLTGLRARVIAQEIERAILAWADRPIRDDLCLVVLKPEAGER
ncbi:MAG TPA: PP2C family protein-serine/threonine phosphatase [Solirubrobacterales bacterium]|nr:PP2C family protein-serine/threonine phosphatase [Solirubrobacterales bacterium]